MNTITVSFTADAMGSEQLEGRIAIIVDVLRASTSIACALQTGAAAAVIPCLTIDDAVQTNTMLTDVESKILLGGERGGVRIEGFDFGNSPLEYSAPGFAGRTIAFTTTNGTKALRNSLSARRVIIGSFVNAAAVTAAVKAARLPLHIACAGTDGRVSSEDVLLAGLLVERLCDADEDLPVDDSARIAFHHWKQAMSGGEPSQTTSRKAIEFALRCSQGGRNLIRLGCDADIRAAAELDSLTVVPEYDPVTDRITAINQDF